MSDALEENDWKTSTGGRNIINPLFAADIYALVKEEHYLEAPTERLDKAKYKMANSADRTKLMRLSPRIGGHTMV